MLGRSGVDDVRVACVAAVYSAQHLRQSRDSAWRLVLVTLAGLERGSVAHA